MIDVWISYDYYSRTYYILDSVCEGFIRAKMTRMEYEELRAINTMFERALDRVAILTGNLRA